MEKINNESHVEHVVCISAPKVILIFMDTYTYTTVVETIYPKDQFS